MILIRDHDKSAKGVPVDSPLAPFTEEILKLRSMFVEQVSSFPAPFNELIMRHHLDRQIRAGDRQMLGEYAPFLLADLFQVPLCGVSEIAVPWLILYEHALLIDDIIDEGGPSLAGDVLLSQVLFDDFISLWRDRFLKYPDLWQAFRQYHREGAFAALEEVAQRSATSCFHTPQPTKWSADRHLLMGRKAALVKFCAAALTEEYSGRLLSAHEECGLDKLCTGIQLLDDLTDSLEDYVRKLYTYPLRAGFEWLRTHHHVQSPQERLFSDDEVLSLLIISGIATQVARLASTYLIDGLKDLQIQHNSIAAGYFLSLAEYNSRIAEELDRTLNENPRFVEVLGFSLCQGEASLVQLLDDPLNKTVFMEMKGNFKRIATASN